MLVEKSPKKKSCCILIPACSVYGDIIESPDVWIGWMVAYFMFILCICDADACHITFDLYSRSCTYRHAE